MKSYLKNNVNSVHQRKFVYISYFEQIRSTISLFDKIINKARSKNNDTIRMRHFIPYYYGNFVY